jgi:hypothetical protein
VLLANDWANSVESVAAATRAGAHAVSPASARTTTRDHAAPGTPAREIAHRKATIMRRTDPQDKFQPISTFRRTTKKKQVSTQGPGKVVCGLKQLERALRVAGVVPVGGGDVGVAVQAQEADGQVASPSPVARCYPF